MWMIEIGEDEEVLYPDELKEEPAIPVILPQTVPVEQPAPLRTLSFNLTPLSH